MSVNYPGESVEATCYARYEDLKRTRKKLDVVARDVSVIFDA
jgi:hypothetical protein